MNSILKFAIRDKMEETNPKNGFNEKKETEPSQPIEEEKGPVQETPKADETKKEENLKKEEGKRDFFKLRICMFFGYNGANYHGLQK